MNGLLLFSTFLSLVVLLLKIDFYQESGWWPHPTVFGFIILAFLLMLTIYIAILTVSPKHFIRFKGYLRKIWGNTAAKVVLFTGYAALFLSIVFFQNLPKVLLSYLDNQLDLLILLFIILTIIFILVGREFSPAFTVQTDKIQSFVGRYFVLIAFIGLVVIKLIILTPNAFVLIAPYDGIQYWSAARQIFYGTLDIAAYHHYPPFYPLLISPVFLFPEKDSIRLISIINIILSSSALFPIFLLARKFFDLKISNLFVLICAFHPFHFVYPTYPSSENLYYPLFIWIIYFLYSQPPKKNIRILWDILTGVLIGLSWITRYQTLPLIPAYLIAWWLKPIQTGDEGMELKPNKQKVFHLLLLLLALAVCMAFWFIPGILQGVPIRELVGLQIEGDLSSGVASIPIYLFWTGISAAYYVLIVASSLFVFLITLFDLRQIKWSANLVRWLVSVGLVAGALFITLAKHAGGASYNHIIPTKLVGRYVIYLAVLIWLTAFILLSKIRETSLKKSGIAAVLSLALILLSYLIFFKTGWIVKGQIINFLYIDGYLPYFIPWIFFILLISCSILFIVLIRRKRQDLAVFLLAFSLAAMNISSIPKYYRSLMDFETTGRIITELSDKVIQSDIYSSSQLRNIQVFVPENDNNTLDQFTARGIDSTGYSLTILTKKQIQSSECNFNMMLQLTDGERFFVQSTQKYCQIENKREISAFQFGDNEYQLFSIGK
jgi:hypothetical protein